MKFGELKKHFPEILSVATFDANLSDESDVTLAEEPKSVELPSVAPLDVQPEDEKDRKIADLETQLTETNKRLAELITKGDQRTDITINVEKANARKANNPLLAAFRRLQRCK